MILIFDFSCLIFNLIFVWIIPVCIYHMLYVYMIHEYTYDYAEVFKHLFKTISAHISSQVTFPFIQILLSIRSPPSKSYFLSNQHHLNPTFYQITTTRIPLSIKSSPSKFYFLTNNHGCDSLFQYLVVSPAPKPNIHSQFCANCRCFMLEHIFQCFGCQNFTFTAAYVCRLCICVKMCVLLSKKTSRWYISKFMIFWRLWSSWLGRHSWFYYILKQSALCQMTMKHSNALRHFRHRTRDQSWLLYLIAG